MQGTLEYHNSFKSEFVLARNVEVYLPPSYSATKPSASQHFPVLYMHDGQNLFNPETSTFGVDWGVIPALEKLIAEQTIPEVIIVGIWSTHKRIQEYLPQRPFKSGSSLEHLKNIDPKLDTELLADNYLKFLTNELKPFIDTNYQTKKDQTFIMGSSMGGLISLYALCEYPDVFMGAGCVSTHWPAVDTVMLEYLAEFLPKANSRKLYFDYGTETLDAQYEPYQLRVDALMKEKGFSNKNWITRKFEGAEHSEQSWRERVQIPLAFLLSQ